MSGSITTNPVLEKYANQAREFFLEKTEFINAKYEFSKDMAEMHSAMVAKKYNELIVEPLLPNGLYVLTATLLGAITVNRRSLPLRFITPIIFGTTASAYLFPKSFNNVTNGLGNLEEKHAPELKQFQDNSIKGLDELKISFIQFEKDLNYSFIDCVRSIKILMLYIYFPLPFI